MKKMNALLIASLCLNLVLVGLMAGGAWKGHKNRPNDRPKDEFGIVMMHVPKETGRELRMQFKEILDKRGDRKNRRQELAGIVAEVPFSSEKLADHFAQNRQNDAEISKIAQAKLIDAISTMTDNERSNLAEQLKNAPSKPPR